jgi:general secretion pathway protein A
MYQSYFRLGDMPFSIAPDPRFLFMSDRHREAIAHLLYGVQGAGGIVLLTGEVGTGKTTLCRSLLEQLPDNIDVAFILNPRMDALELLQTICEEYHIEVPTSTTSVKALVDALNARLLSAHAQGRRAILIVDEAQNLNPVVPEQLRLLTNLETNTHKLLQIFLIGQPELQTLLAKPEMRQVSQRVVARYHLSHLNQDEVAAYIAHRLRVAGASPLIFPATLSGQVYRASRGTPRLINLICDRALLGTYAKNQQQVSGRILRQAIKEVLAESLPRPHHRRTLLVSILGVSAVLAAALVIAPTPNENHPALPGTTLAASSPVVVAASSPVATTEAASSTPAISALQWQQSLTADQSKAAAYTTLFKLYDLPTFVQPGSVPCTLIETHGMRCYNGHGGLADLFLLNQPIVIPLSNPGQPDMLATLVALDRQSATLQIGDTTQQIASSELAHVWSGQFTAIWHVPPGFNGELAQNQHGAEVSWLRSAMQQVDGITSNDSNVFDPALAQRVRSFQLTEGIQPDGLVGPLTVIKLNLHNNAALPRLLATEGK